MPVYVPQHRYSVVANIFDRDTGRWVRREGSIVATDEKSATRKGIITLSVGYDNAIVGAANTMHSDNCEFCY